MDNKNLENSLCLIIGKDKYKTEKMIKDIIDTYPKGEIHQVSIMSNRIVEVVTTKRKVIKTMNLEDIKLRGYRPKEIFVDTEIDNYETLHYVFPLLQNVNKEDIHGF